MIESGDGEIVENAIESWIVDGVSGVGIWTARMTASDDGVNDGGLNDGSSSDDGLMTGNDSQENVTGAGLSDGDLVTLNDGDGHHDHRHGDRRVHQHAETDSDHPQKNVHGPKKIAGAGAAVVEAAGPSVRWALRRMSIASRRLEKDDLLPIPSSSPPVISGRTLATSNLVSWE
ncbi:MAG: hypothetical protein Q9204_007948 [Flavoplaca sp. TL-2023a]